jgi:hypothetical protein
VAHGPHDKIDPAYTIRILPTAGFVDIIMRGFWSAEDQRRFDRDLRAMLPALPAAGCRIGEQVTLFDLTAFQVQGQDVIAGLTRMASDPAIGSRRVAVLLSSGLLKLQARRVAPGYGLFDCRETAMAWLAGASDGRSSAA